MVTSISELRSGINALIDEFESSQTPTPAPVPPQDYTVTLVDTVNGIFKVVKNYDATALGVLGNTNHSIELFDESNNSLLSQVTGDNVLTYLDNQ